MAPRGAPRRPVTPGPDPLALITGKLFSFFLLLSMVLPTAYGLPTRTERLISENDKYYAVDGQDGQILCLLCPAGTYVKDDCTVPYTRGTCEICVEGTFSQYASGLSECLRCDTCREDQEEVSHCIINKNTVCQCKKGTFCPPDQPCEICMPCTGSCPEDEVIKAPCNSTLDSECPPPSSSTSTRDTIIACVVSSVILIIIIIAVCVYRKKKSTNTGSKLFGKGNEDQDEAKGDLLQRDIILQFKEGTDKDTKEGIIYKSWPIIVRLVPIKEFESLMNSLGLSHNELDRAKADNPGNVNNQYSAMLQTWYQKGEFDINTLLKSLRSLGLEKAAHDITDQLTSDGLYIEENQQ
ncbi:tumor necrosis factor receptor superfamily member 10A-like isoform X2 [Rana temporaria]|uniref:tumor necrosis factor receptor superfamily member 10A-like isoform X2 n=1 Tax=Rana temporaria TaxID=8407 RepID=UPI001AAD6AFF|nr:tumor necrosis factor receptor superfamily member 10A-like isoform X2 [Rana temporaria]